MSNQKQEAPVASKPAQGRFPKFTDVHNDWKVLVNNNKPGEDDENKVVWYRIVERTRKKIDLTIKSPLRSVVVSRNIRELLDQNQHQFGLQGAGTTMFGGCYPLFESKLSDKVAAYTQGYRFTIRIV